MTKSSNDDWDIESGESLAQVLATIHDPKMMHQFLHDVLTPKEISEISARLEAASMLQEGATYAQVIARTKLSSRTVARVSNWLQHGTGGFLTALDMMRTAKTKKPRVLTPPQ